jgi:hypothetical protein
MGRKSHDKNKAVARVIYVVDEGQLERMETLKKQFGITTNQALVNHALLLANSIAVEIRKGRKVVFVEEGKIKGELIIPTY